MLRIGQKVCVRACATLIKCVHVKLLCCPEVIIIQSSDVLFHHHEDFRNRRTDDPTTMLPDFAFSPLGLIAENVCSIYDAPGMSVRVCVCVRVHSNQSKIGLRPIGTLMDI